MTPLGKILKNTSALALAQILNPLVAIFLTMSLARLGGSAGLGVYTFAISLVALFEILACLGVREYVVREVARRPEDWSKYFFTTVLLGSGSALLLQCALMLFSHVMGYDAAMRSALFLAGFSLYPTVIYNASESIFAASQQMQYPSAVTIGENFVRALLSIACLRLGYEAQTLFIVFVLSRTLSGALLVTMLFRKMGRPAWQWDRSTAQKILRVAPTFALLAGAAALYWRLDLLFLSKFGGNTEVGIYNAAYRLMYIFYMIASSLMTSLYPLFSRSFTEAPEQFHLLGAKTMKYLLLAFFPIAVMTTMLAPQIVPLLYGEAFAASVQVLQLVIWVIIPLGIAGVFANTLLASNQQRKDLQVNLARLAIALVLFAVLVPRFGSLGAIAALLFSLLAGVFLQYQFLARQFSKTQLARYIGKPALASLAMAAVMLSCAELHFLIAAALGVCGYIAAIMLQNTFNGADRSFLAALRMHKGFEPCR